MLRLFTKSYSRDLPWLQLAIESVNLRCQERVAWTIVVDRGEKDQLVSKLPKTDKIIFQVHEIQEHWGDAAELGSGYIQQQWVKMTAHRVMGTDYFLNWDSDVAALRNFNSSDFKNQAYKPILWFTPFNDLMTGGDEAVHRLRQDYIKNIFHLEEAPFEWMRCMPIWMHGEILRIGESRPEWRRTHMNMRSDMVAGLSEFNLIGQMSNMLFPDAYDYKNTQTSNPTWAGPTDSKTAVVSQFWSWGSDVSGARRAVGL